METYEKLAKNKNVHLIIQKWLICVVLTLANLIFLSNCTEKKDNSATTTSAAKNLLDSSSISNPVTIAEQKSSIIPATFAGRSVTNQGKLNVSVRTIALYTWDSGVIDGDIVSLYLNGRIIVNQYTLTGSKRRIDVSLDYCGYNYLLLFAHNEGSISPNTAAVSLDDGSGEKSIVLSANLSTNGAYDVVLGGSGSGCSFNDTNSTTTTPTTTSSICAADKVAIRFENATGATKSYAVSDSSLCNGSYLYHGDHANVPTGTTTDYVCFTPGSYYVRRLNDCWFSVSTRNYAAGSKHKVKDAGTVWYYYNE